MKIKHHCCEEMRERLKFECSQHLDVFECPDNLVSYSVRFDEYGLIVHDGGTASVLIKHCPWCGKKLPESKRDEWFDRLETLGYDNPSKQDIPPEFLSGEWYEKQESGR